MKIRRAFGPRACQIFLKLRFLCLVLLYMPRRGSSTKVSAPTPRRSRVGPAPVPLNQSPPAHAHEISAHTLLPEIHHLAPEKAPLLDMS